MAQMRWSDFLKGCPDPLSVLVEVDPDRSGMSFNLMFSITKETSPKGGYAFRPADGLLEIAFEKLDDAKTLAKRLGAVDAAGDGETGPWRVDLDTDAFNRLQGTLPTQNRHPPRQPKRRPSSRSSI